MGGGNVADGGGDWLEHAMAQRRAYQIWIEQCEAVEAIKTRFGLKAAFDYIVGEKLLNLRPPRIIQTLRESCPGSSLRYGACLRPMRLKHS
jgi:hypothetical protein